MKTEHKLPQMAGDLFITDGGIETTLIFHEGLDLPLFASFHLLATEEGTEALRRYYRTYTELARRFKLGFVLESATWRASADWGEKLGYSASALESLNRKAISLLHELRDESTNAAPMVVSGCLGPRGDGYSPQFRMTVDQSRQYHAPHARYFREEGAEMMSAMTMNYPEEAIGITQAAQQSSLPVAISFTVETDGRLPTGETLREAIEQVDEATNRGPSYYMINCAHPTHFDAVLKSGDAWVQRIGGLRCNASMLSHAELNEATELDEGNPEEFGSQCSELQRQLPQLTVLGGCCGTDHRHVEAICKQFAAKRSK